MISETNLKIYQTLRKTNEFQNENALSSLRGEFHCDLPNSDIYKFSGLLRLENFDPLPIGTQQLLIRGTLLRNTEWIIGLVTYTGKETKYVLNST